MYLEFDKKKIFYSITKSGKSKALIFIHGSGGSSYIWKNQLNLSINYDIIALDLPSHDKSDKISDLSLSLYVDVVYHLIQALNYEDVILCGHSLGGAIVQQFFFTYPKEVSGLILCGTGGRLKVDPTILVLLKNNDLEFLDSLPAKAFYHSTPKETIEEYTQETSEISAEVTYRDFKICDNFDILNKIDAIKIPCLIIVGERDKLTPVKYSEFSHKKIPISKLHIIKNAGHMVMLERPKEVNQAIESFCRNYF